MQRDNRTLKPLMFGGLVFVTLGVTLASDMLSRFGLEDNYVVVFSVAFIIAGIILSKNLTMFLTVLLGVVLCNLPDATLSSYNLDRDILLASVCAIVMAPAIYDLFIK